MAAVFESPNITEPRGVHARTIIFLHGRGSQGEEFAAEFFEGKATNGQTLLESFPNTKWIFPSAPERFSTVFQEEMDEWFDIYSLTFPNSEQQRQKVGLSESIRFITSLIGEEINAGTEPRHIILAGISQGFATAVHVLLSSPYDLGGFIGLSGWLPFSDTIPTNVGPDASGNTSFGTIKAFYQDVLSIDASTNEDTLKTPVFISHAKDDAVVESHLGKHAAEILKSLGLQVEWHEYDEGEHWINEPQGYDDISSFISKCQAE